MAADPQQLRQFRRFQTQDAAIIHGLPLLRGQFFQQFLQHAQCLPLQDDLLGAANGRKQILGRQGRSRMPAAVINTIFSDRKQPTLRAAGIVQLLELFPGFTERRVRSFVCFAGVPGQLAAERQQLAAGRIDVFQIEGLSFLKGKKNGLFTVSVNETANAREDQKTG